MSSDAAPSPPLASSNPPFWYASFNALWVHYAIPSSLAAQYLEGTGLKPMVFGGVSLMNLCFMNYASHAGMQQPQAYADILKPVDANIPAQFGVEPTNECELNIVGYPEAAASRVPQGISLEDYLLGRDHTKTIGNYRLWVPCDDRIAVYWGRKNFGENKLQTHPFKYTVPAWNSFPPNMHSWDYTIPGLITEAPGTTMFNVTATLSGGAKIGNSSEVIDYSMYPSTGTRRLAASRRNAFGIFSTYVGSEALWQATVNPGNSSHPIVQDLSAMISAGTLAAAQSFMTQPTVAESAPFYVDV